MNILIACDKFKGSLSAQDVCSSIQKGIDSVNLKSEIVTQALADGGDGSLALLKDYLPIKKVEVKVTSPVNKKILAFYYISKNTAYIELAVASGLAIVPISKRSPSLCTSKGTGELMEHAILQGCTEIYLFLGGSSTNDAGIGVASGLGCQFLDERSEILEPIGANLQHIHSIQKSEHSQSNNVNINILCDVKNPMFGQNGAARVFSKQKGATASDIENLEAGMVHFSQILQSYNQDFDPFYPGMGAAGGIACALSALYHARLQSGFKFVELLTGLEEKVQSADVIITGEGCIDDSSYDGKVTGSMLRLAKKYNKKIIFVAGKIEDAHFLESHYPKYSCIEYAANLDDSILNAKKNLITIGTDIAAQLLSSLSKK